jgi:hypothetical protein
MSFLNPSPNNTSGRDRYQKLVTAAESALVLKQHVVTAVSGQTVLLEDDLGRPIQAVGGICIIAKEGEGFIAPTDYVVGDDNIPVLNVPLLDGEKLTIITFPRITSNEAQALLEDHERRLQEYKENIEQQIADFIESVTKSRTFEYTANYAGQTNFGPLEGVYNTPLVFVNGVYVEDVTIDDETGIVTISPGAAEGASVAIYAPGVFQEQLAAVDEILEARTVSVDAAVRAEEAADRLDDAVNLRQQKLIAEAGQTILDFDSNGEPIMAYNRAAMVMLHGMTVLTPGDDYAINSEGTITLVHPLVEGTLVTVITFPYVPLSDTQGIAHAAWLEAERAKEAADRSEEFANTAIHDAQVSFEIQEGVSTYTDDDEGFALDLATGAAIVSVAPYGILHRGIDYTIGNDGSITFLQEYEVGSLVVINRRSRVANSEASAVLDQFEDRVIALKTQVQEMVDYVDQALIEDQVAFTVADGQYEYTMDDEGEPLNLVGKSTLLSVAPWGPQRLGEDYEITPEGSVKLLYQYPTGSQILIQRRGRYTNSTAEAILTQFEERVADEADRAEAAVVDAMNSAPFVVKDAQDFNGREQLLSGVRYRSPFHAWDTTAIDAGWYNTGGVGVKPVVSSPIGISLTALGLMEGDDATPYFQKAIEIMGENPVRCITCDPGHYLLDPIVFIQLENLILNMPGCRFDRKTQPPNAAGQNLIEFLGCNKVKVLGITLGTSSGIFGSEGQKSAFTCYGSREVQFIDCISYDSMCDGFYIDRWTSARHGVAPPGGIPVMSKNITTFNCKALRGYRQGISVIACDGFVDFNSVFAETGTGPLGGTAPAAGMDLESNAGQPYAPNCITLIGTRFEGNRGAGLSTTTSSTAVTAIGCQMKGNGSYGVFSRSSLLELIGCEIYDNGSRWPDGSRPSVYIDYVDTEKPIQVLLRNCRIKGALSGAILTHNAHLELDNVIIEDCYTFGVRYVPSAGGIKNIAERIRIKDVIIRNLMEGGPSITGNAALMLVNATVPVEVDGLILDNSNIPTGETGIIRGLDFLNAADVRSVKGVKISGAFSTFAHRGFPAVKSVSDIYVDGVKDTVLSREGVTVISTNANATLTPNQTLPDVIHTGTLTAARSITLATTNAVAGKTRWKIARTGGGAFDLNVGGITTLATGQWCEVVYDGTAYRLIQRGSLA